MIIKYLRNIALVFIFLGLTLSPYAGGVPGAGGAGGPAMGGGQIDNMFDAAGVGAMIGGGGAIFSVIIAKSIRDAIRGSKGRHKKPHFKKALNEEEFICFS